jgi:FAD/FMN-containing dehydrogenase
MPSEPNRSSGKFGNIIMWAVPFAVLVGAVSLAFSATIAPDALDSVLGKTCRCFPGDACWPSQKSWGEFNRTLGGKLIATVPVASACHDDFAGLVSFDAAECARVQENWAKPEFHIDTTHSPMAAFFANESCDPFTDRTAPCKVGSYVAYAVAATNAADYKATIAFARKNNIRLVIRNTGHDYMGKSTGAGSLALWTHNLKTRSIVDYKSSGYTGKAMVIGAGVQAFEAQETANAKGYVVVEGDCPTVGLAGGYTQGGGSSPLASRFGMGADQVLEWEVVTADSKLVKATPTQNSDLYWALSGGGGGTYGAVVSMTVKLHPDAKTAGAVLSFSDPTDAHWEIIKTFIKNLPAVVDVGGTIYWMALPGNIFAAPQMYLPGGTAEGLEKLLNPTLSALKAAKIPYEFSSKTYANFLEAYNTLNPGMDIVEVNLGGRLIPRSSIKTSESSTTLVDTIKYIVNSGALFAGVCQNASKKPTFANAVLPAWRDTLFLAFYGIPYDRTNYQANIAAQKKVTNELNPALKAITPNSGAYLNEADINEPDWQESFYGANYQKLAKIKCKYDPEGIFWGPTTVGSEKWKVAEGGRLCKA